MHCSVVVPTLNGRDRLGECLDALAEHAPAAEVVVVNGPSSDGTTGMIKERPDVDALVEISDRNVNVARNAGFAAAEGDAVAVVSYDRVIDEGWYEALLDALEGGADVVSGPTRTSLTDGDTGPAGETRDVPHCNEENVALTREAVDQLDGFDEYLDVGGCSDLSHRREALAIDFEWRPEMSVHSRYGTDGGRSATDRRDLYRSLSYQLVKNYGPRPSVLYRALREAGADAVGSAEDVVRGDDEASSWLGKGRDAVAGLSRGFVDGVRSRRRDKTARRNPYGLSSRHDRAVTAYDWR